MAVRARPASSTPQDTVEKFAERAHVPVAGEGDARGNRLIGLGSLAGLVAGVGTGVLLGAVRCAVWRPGTVAGGVVATVAALVAGNGSMVLLGITDPRTWARADWVSDVVPYLAYGAVMAAVLEALDPPRHHRRPRALRT